MSTDQRSESKWAIKLDPDFGRWLKKTRISLGFPSQRDLADKAQVNRTWLQLMEKGEAYPYYLSTFERVAGALDIEFGYFLYKAGLDIGREGVDLAKIRRAEAIADAYESFGREFRDAIAEAMNVLDPRLPPLEERAADRAISDLGRVLGLLDLADGRLRADGWIQEIRRDHLHQPVALAPWAEEDDEYLRQHRDLSHEDVARALNRSVDAVRHRRSRIADAAYSKGEA